MGVVPDLLKSIRSHTAQSETGHTTVHNATQGALQCTKCHRAHYSAQYDAGHTTVHNATQGTPQGSMRERACTVLLSPPSCSPTLSRILRTQKGLKMAIFHPFFLAPRTTTVNRVEKSCHLTWLSSCKSNGSILKHYVEGTIFPTACLLLLACHPEIINP